MTAAKAGRPNQRQRTRKDLLQAASRLMMRGGKPNLEEIAQEAMVSRATAYRYFPTADALLLEAALDVATPEAADIFAGESSGNSTDRVFCVDAALQRMIDENEPQLRMMLAKSLERSVSGDSQSDVPSRQNRRTPLIEAALEPAHRKIKPSVRRMLARALALVIGTEATIVTRDVLQLSNADAEKVRRWAIRALVEAAERS
ncbi:TetR/AcrR family transcriptional regulator [Parvibaculum sp.]|uniref:TetR/AcrR family transcriptional regulator n=1 Tax=Parvibaculum sp. TaxID=2024848 RepID=UPI0027307B05|nr:TetR/AcrR family transcriptional regulator [Parvibaculum sp.]MDP1627767.1 TetR/AcrR family transcriptional regulator [Parvibaculum sp.]MDP2150765.1 TetR/AcrR family transcriptional regulator [Parvibaculum sp.]MDP3328837.1 TetR/AcrR family transcriptional regulator [Parvibaculum sp.]